jgi:hypothetical protein
MRKTLHFLIIVITVLVLSLGLVPMNTALADGPTLVSVSAPSAVNPGEQFTVDIAVEPGTAIAGLQFNLAFDPAVVTADSVAEGNLLSQGGASTYFSAGTIDNVAGTISGVAGVITTPGQSVAIPEIFAVITMTAGSQTGTSSVTLSEVIVGDINGQAVEISVANDQVPVTQEENNGGSSGGGGGGGGGGEGGVTSLLDSMTSDGTITSEVTATDDELKVKLIISKGTTVKNKYGQKVSSIRIKKSTGSNAADTDSRLISLSYDILPSGTTFSPPATLVFKYTDSEIPDEISDDSLYEAVWDPTTSEWTDLGGTVDPATHTVSVPVEHLSVYALMAHTRPASFEISDFQLSSQQVAPGNSLTISAVVTNSGDLTGSYEVMLKMDDAVVEEKTVTLNGGRSEAVSFSITPPDGEHQASIGSFSANFSVNELPAPAAFTVSNLVVSPAVINTGESAIVTVFVTNTGGMAGTYNTVLQMDDIEVQARTIELNSGESREVVFTINAEAAGQHTLTAGGLQTPFTVRVTPPVTIVESANTKEGINSFRVTPIYDDLTGVLISARIEYRMDVPGEPAAGTGLILKVYYEGALLEEIPLLSIDNLTTGVNSVSLDYTPSTGWETGLYSFQAELYQNDSPVQNTESIQLTVTPELKAAVVSWQILGIIIGAALILAGIVVIGVVVRRREMLRVRINDK